VNIYVSARKLTMPAACPCCDGHPDSEMNVSHTRRTGKRVIREQTRSWTFPYCGRCVAHVATWNAADAIASGTVAIGIIGGIVLGFVATAVIGVLFFVASLPLALVFAARARRRARAELMPGCVSPGSCVGYLGWDGSLQGFDVGSNRYAERFARANLRSLVNVSADLRRLLETEPIAPVIQVTVEPPRSNPPPSSATPRSEASVPVHKDLVLDWIARIASYKGPVARRNALKRALDEVFEPSARHAIVLAASKIEATAVLEKADALATPSAKRRHLERAIADIRSDDIPDELQREELAMLEAALRDIGP
jgi:hypothetical protein